MNNVKTTLLGLGQLVMVVAFAWAKLRNGLPFTDAETALIGTMLLSGVKGVVSADAKPKDAP